MVQKKPDLITKSLADRCVQLSAGCDVDCAAVERWNVDLATLRRLAEAYRNGWLHNVMSRITPLTLRRQEDYLMMADLFIDTEDAAYRLLDKFQTDMELFCQLAGIEVTEHMTGESASDELQAHVALYRAIAGMLGDKFNFMPADPIQEIATSPVEGMDNPFVKSFLEERFSR